MQVKGQTSELKQRLLELNLKAQKSGAKIMEKVRKKKIMHKQRKKQLILLLYVVLLLFYFEFVFIFSIKN